MDGLRPLSIGWHGKLPARGDFVGRGLPRSGLHAWDEWLQRSLALADRRWGRALRAHMLAMPSWQGLVRRAKPTAPAWAVVVVASSDRVGRAYPLLLAEAHDEGTLSAVPLAAWRARALDIAQWLHVAAPQATLKEFEAGVANIGATPWPAQDHRPETDCVGDLFGRWPAERSFWWRAEPDANMLAPRVQPWPPRETLLLDWLGEDDTLPGEAAVA